MIVACCAESNVTEIKLGLVTFSSKHDGPDAIGPYESTAAATMIALDKYRKTGGLANVSIRYVQAERKQTI